MAVFKIGDSLVARRWRVVLALFNVVFYHNIHVSTPQTGRHLVYGKLKYWPRENTCYWVLAI